jgi:hypothetical protein
MDDIGKRLLVIGSIIIILGALVWIGAKLGIPFGSLPGDFYFNWGSFSLYLPLGSSAVVSLLIMILVKIFVYFRQP